MGGGGGKDSKSTGSLPWWAEGAHRTLINEAENWAYEDAGKYIKYPDPRIAGFTDPELASQQARQDLFDAGDPSSAFAAEQYSLASGLGSDITDYATREFTNQEMTNRMSPYMEGVIQPQLREARESYNRNRNQSEANSVARGGSIGSYRVGLEDSLSRQQEAESLSDIRGAGQQSAYETALRSFESDRMMGVQGLGAAAGIYGDIGSRASKLGLDSQASELQRINELARSGAEQREMTQAGYDMSYQDFIEQRDYPMRNMQFMSGILTGVPSGIGTTSTSMPDASIASQIASLGIGAAGLGSLYNGTMGQGGG
jgi:hypothetical protein